MNSALAYIPAWAWPYIDLVAPQQWWYAANAAFLLVAVFVAMFIHYCFRRATGYERFKGNWYSPNNFEKLKQEIYSGVREGRLPDSETMQMLDKHIYGKESKLRNISGNGWL